jgi:hypothetical protein
VLKVEIAFLKIGGILTTLPKLSVEEIDRLIENLDKAMDSTGATNDAVGTNREKIESTCSNIEFGQSLYLELPSEIWAEFQEYCKQNELDPAQQVREAVASYYKDLLQVCKIRTKIDASYESSHT